MATAQSEAKNRPESGAWTLRSAYTLAFLTIIYGFNTADRNIFGLLMPLIQADMNMSDTMLGLMSGLVFALFYTFAGLPVAWLADRWSRRNIIAIGFTIWSIATICTGLVQNAIQMALSRFLLGAGEAAGIAPSNSMVSDLFDKTRRTLALSVLQTANALGILFSFPIIGWIAHHHGWRMAFIAAGAPGILLALIFFFTVKEPERGATDKEKPPETAPADFISTMKRLLSTRSYVLVVLSSMLVGVSLAGVQTWIPTFLARIHELNPQDIGAYIGFIRGPAGILGAISGGFLTTKLAQRDERWLVWTPALFMILLLMSDLGMLYAVSGVGWKVGMALETFFGSAQVGPMFALCLMTSDARTRAVATALLLLVVHLLGLTTGPLIVGVLNDMLAPSMGAAAIRYSITVAALFSLGASIVCLTINKSVKPEAAASR
ncbi:spinster family MFS transporter [Hyphococcus luteus]|uniref:spinster family MFS transporter n=1 Tax=Hyphococcus luteus TaxID=2058213 RepID=UPI0013FD7692|nr:MFS transporter [Marinicaulis flavus]